MGDLVLDTVEMRDSPPVAHISAKKTLNSISCDQRKKILIEFLVSYLAISSDIQWRLLCFQLAVTD